MSRTGGRFAGIFLVALGSLAYEVMLTRYFTVASWAEYGYWVISIAMLGFSLSGVVLALFRSAFVRRAEGWLMALPLLILFFAAAGYHWVTLVPFNPLELQNPVLWSSQVWNIGKFYLALLPFFFCCGAYIGLMFMAYQDDMPKLYAFDLLGAGIGAMVILGLMFWLHPFYLVCAVLPFPALAALVHLRGHRGWMLACVVLFAACEAALVFNNHARFFEYKAIYPLLHVADNQVLEEHRAPEGYYLLLDNFTERRDISITNNLGLLNIPGPPRSLGLYKDGNRMVSIPVKAAEIDFGYLQGALASFPYLQAQRPRVLLVGTGGGFRLMEAGALGAADIVALESDPLVVRLATAPEIMNHPVLANTVTEVVLQSPQAYLGKGRVAFDLIEVTEEYLEGGSHSAYAYTAEAIDEYLASLGPQGVLSISMSIRDFPGYAAKLAQTIHDALVQMDVKDPGGHVIAYRSEWEVRFLVSPQPFEADYLAALRAFCDERSFDLCYFQGIDPAAMEAWNMLPPFSFEAAEIDWATAPADALAPVFADIFQGRSVLPEFRVQAITNDRPFPYYMIRPTHLPRLKDKLDIIPMQELGQLTSSAVLIQAILFALLIAALPLLRVGRIEARRSTIARGILYFACLGLGFLAIEIALIERFAWVFRDRVTAFAVILSSMLVWSGLGSYLSGQLRQPPRRILLGAASVIAGATMILFVLLFDPIANALASLPLVPKALAVTLLVAPLSAALGMPFPTGLSHLRGPMTHFVPLAWAINGAFSVVASPLASLLAIYQGYNIVLLSAAGLYLVAWMALPGKEANTQS